MNPMMLPVIADAENQDAHHPQTAQEPLHEVVIRFAGDSGDGMQVTGGQFTSTSALVGNDLSTLPDFPAEIRAPAGTLPGVSAFQVRIADYDIHTPGDAPDVLVAMNPAALKANLRDLKPNGVVIVNTDEFVPRNFKKVGIEKNPLEDGTLAGSASSRPISPPSPSAPSRTAAWMRARRSAARTSSPSACATGCSAGPWSPPSSGWRSASPPSPSSPPPTSR